MEDDRPGRFERSGLCRSIRRKSCDFRRRTSAYESPRRWRGCLVLLLIAGRAGRFCVAVFGVSWGRRVVGRARHAGRGGRKRDLGIPDPDRLRRPRRVSTRFASDPGEGRIDGRSRRPEERSRREPGSKSYVATPVWGARKRVRQLGKTRRPRALKAPPGKPMTHPSSAGIAGSTAHKM
jgi:hypothetical protein